MRELTVEQFLIEETRRRGGLCLKLGLNGWPDRVVILNGHVAFVELKAPGEVARPLQLARHRELRAAGAYVAVVDSLAGALVVMKVLEAM